jgi:Domain of unknown function (DUF1995)
MKNRMSGGKSCSGLRLLPILLRLLQVTLWPARTTALLSFIDGGKEIPTLYNAYYNGQIAKQAATAVSKAVTAGKTKLEVNFPPVPNLDEVRFGTPLNQKFGSTIVAKDLKLPGGYFPGSDIARQQVAFANMYWAKKICPAVSGGLLGSGGVTVVSAEPVTYNQIKDKGGMTTVAPLQSSRSVQPSGNGACIAVNPGGEETWERIRTTYMTDGNKSPFVILNNAFSTMYGLGNKRGYEEAYYLKRISKGWVFRAFPGPWLAYLEKPDGTVELLQSYRTKPELNQVATLVREESFRRYAINNDRWSKGFGERL